MVDQQKWATFVFIQLLIKNAYAQFGVPVYPPPMMPMPIHMAVAVPMKIKTTTTTESAVAFAVPVPVPMPMPVPYAVPPPPPPPLLCQGNPKPKGCPPCPPPPMPAPAFPMAVPMPPPPPVLMVPFPPPIAKLKRPQSSSSSDSSDSSCDTDTDTDSSSDSSSSLDWYNYRKRNYKRAGRKGKKGKRGRKGKRGKRRNMRARRRNIPQRAFSDGEFVKPVLTYLSKNGDIKIKKRITNNEAAQLLDENEFVNGRRSQKYQILTGQGRKQGSLVVLSTDEDDTSSDQREQRILDQREKHIPLRKGLTNHVLKEGKKQIVFKAPENKKITNLSMTFNVE